MNYKAVGQQVALTKLAAAGELAGAGVGGALGATISGKYFDKLPLPQRLKQAIRLIPGGEKTIGGIIGAIPGLLLGRALSKGKKKERS